ncbi:MAG: hypothetical protein HOY78_28315 [Saccharothrix sp.]|nr:hypothetical protein [Saccharothrix sp.]
MISLFVVALVAIVKSATDGSPSASQPPPSPTPCPTEVSTWLPDGGPLAVLIASYTTTKHKITLCRDAAGRPFYDGRVLGAEVTPDTHIVLPATKTSTGFVAENGAFTYEISNSEVLVSQNGRLLTRAALTPATR